MFEMKKFVIVAIELVQHKNDLGKPKLKPEGYLILKGFAVSAENGRSFSIVKITFVSEKACIAIYPSPPAYGTVLHEMKGILPVFPRGVIRVDGNSIHIRNVAFGNDSVAGKLYNGNTLLGQFHIVSSLKENRKVWNGTMNLDDKVYHLYLFSIRWQEKLPLTGHRKTMPVRNRQQQRHSLKAFHRNL